MTIRVMLVDDHRIVREGLAYMLGGIADVHLVGEAGSGRELLAILSDGDPNQVQPDVILLDVHMPEMSGLDTLDEIRRRHPEIKVIMLSMHDQAAYVRKAMQLGASGYVLKSIGLDELVRVIDVVSTGKSYVQGELAAALVAAPHEPGLPHLSPREFEVLRLLSRGYENKQIARRLGISEATVKTHIKAIYGRLKVRSRAEAAATALRLGLID